MGATKSTRFGIPQKKFNRMCVEFQRLINVNKSEGYKGMLMHAEAMKFCRVVELVETQSVESA